MSVMIQIRNVPDDVHRVLKSRAALAGMSLSEYLLQELAGTAKRPTKAEFRARLDAMHRDWPMLDVDTVAIIREMRGD